MRDNRSNLIMTSSKRFGDCLTLVAEYEEAREAIPWQSKKECKDYYLK